MFRIALPLLIGLLLSAPLDERQTARWSGGQMSVANASLVRLRTDSGVDGIGELTTHCRVLG